MELLFAGYPILSVPASSWVAERFQRVTDLSEELEAELIADSLRVFGDDVMRVVEEWDTRRVVSAVDEE